MKWTRFPVVHEEKVRIQFISLDCNSRSWLPLSISLFSIPLIKAYQMTQGEEMRVNGERERERGVRLDVDRDAYQNWQGRSRLSVCRDWDQVFLPLFIYFSICIRIIISIINCSGVWKWEVVCISVCVTKYSQSIHGKIKYEGDINFAQKFVMDSHNLWIFYI